MCPLNHHLYDVGSEKQWLVKVLLAEDQTNTVTAYDICGAAFLTKRRNIIVPVQHL